MALPVIVQTASLATSSAAPASVAPTWSATVGGSTLIAIIGSACSAPPTISTPANWTAGGKNTGGGSAVDIRIFYYVNNPGSLTTATWNLTNVNGCVVAFWEVSGLNAVAPYDTAVPSGNSATSGTAASSNAYPAFLTGNMFQVGGIANLTPQTLTPANVAGTLGWTTGPTGTSTVGATNVLLTTFSLIQGSNPLPGASLAGTLSGSSAWCGSMWAFMSTSSGQLSHYVGGQLAAAGGVGMGYATGI